MSVDLQDAYEKDMSFIHEDGQVEYLDSTQQTMIEAETAELKPALEYTQENQSNQMSNDDFFAGIEGGYKNE